MAQFGQKLDSALTRELDEAQAKSEAENRAAMERQRAEAMRMQAAAFAVQTWPHLESHLPEDFRALADEIHAFLTGLPGEK